MRHRLTQRNVFGFEINLFHFQIFKIIGTNIEGGEKKGREGRIVGKWRQILHQSETDATWGISAFTLVKFSLSNLTSKSLFTP